MKKTDVLQFFQQENTEKIKEFLALDPLPRYASQKFFNQRLVQAAKHGCLDVVHLLLPFSDPMHDDSEAFQFAAGGGHWDLSEFMTFVPPRPLPVLLQPYWLTKPVEAELISFPRLRFD